MEQIKYLTKNQIISINEEVIKIAKEGLISVLDDNGLESIVDSPKQSFFGIDAYPTIWLKSAYYLQKISKKHVFADGNKRTAYQSAEIFLLMNGYYLEIPTKEAGEFVLKITTSPDSESVMLEIAKFLKDHSFPYEL